MFNFAVFFFSADKIYQNFRITEYTYNNMKVFISFQNFSFEIFVFFKTVYYDSTTKSEKLNTVEYKFKFYDSDSMAYLSKE